MNKIIFLSITLNTSPERAFALFSQPELLQSWLAPKAEVELELGGKYELFWDLADLSSNSTQGCCITALVPQHLLAFEWRSPRQFQHFANQADPLTHCVLSFQPVAGGVNLHLLHSGWRHTPEWEAAREWQEASWQMAFAALEQLPMPA